MDEIETHTLVIGASGAGLSAGAALKKHGVEHLIVEAAGQVGTPWRNHYDRLHLHTPRFGSSLPYLSMPRSFPKYPARQQVVDYLEGYRATFGLEPHFNQRARRVYRDGESWHVETDERRYRAENVIVATGITRVPNIPSWPGLDDYGGDLLHSSKYKNGSPWQGKQVLVVGFGNSACEIAIDLYECGAYPSMAVRDAVNIVPKDFFGIPVLTVGIVMSPLPAPLADKLARPLFDAVLGDYTKHGLRRPSYGPIQQIKEKRQIPVLDIGVLDLIKRGVVRVYPGIERFTKRGVKLGDGRAAEFDAVILGTGYRPRLDEFIDRAEEVTDAEGFPLESGRPTRLPGLYFCGFYISPAGMFREMGLEAERIAKHIAAAG